MAAKKKKTSEQQNNPPPNQKVERFTENLPVVLTSEQIAERANRAAHRISDRDHMEEELKAYTKTEKSKIAKVESEIRHLSEEVRTKTTYQDVHCERRYDYDSGRVQEVRTDTGVVLSDREMNEREKQRELFDGEDKDLDDEFADDVQDDADATAEGETADEDNEDDAAE